MIDQDLTVLMLGISNLLTWVVLILYRLSVRKSIQSTIDNTASALDVCQRLTLAMAAIMLIDPKVLKQESNNLANLTKYIARMNKNDQEN